METVAAPASEVAVVDEIPHHTISIPKPHVCRICDDDEDKDGEGVVELGCRCKGEMSRVHKTCFLQWFGARILLSDNYDCDVCNSKLAFETQMLVAQAVSDHVNGGRKSLMKGLQSELGQRAISSAQRAGNFDELVQVLMEVNAPMLQRNPSPPSRFPRRGPEFWALREAEEKFVGTMKQLLLLVALICLIGFFGGGWFPSETWN